MLRLVILLSLVVYASGGKAEIVEIRAGEHPTFTRMIVDLPQRLEWQLKESDGSALLSFDGDGIKFDTTAAFLRISRARLIDVTATEQGNLRIDLGCDCVLSTFWFGKSLFVLDIRDPAEESQKSDLQAKKPKNESEPLKRQARKTKTPPLLLPRHPKSLAATLTASQFQQTADVEEPNLDANQKRETEGEGLVAKSAIETRNRLVEQIGRAATQGLLSPRTNLDTATKAAKTEQKPLENRSVNPRRQPVASGVSNNINLQAQSSIDRDLLAQLQLGAENFGVANCLDTNRVNIADWGNDLPFGQQIASHRIRLIGEFDKVDNNVAASLARLYLYFGFGAEARFTLDLVAEDYHDLALLETLAAIMEDGFAPSGSMLMSQLECQSPAALWSVLSYETLPVETPVDTDAVLRSFSSLPRHLRNHLGPTLSRRFLEIGHRDAAQSVLRILDRSDKDATPISKLIAAEIDILKGDEFQAAATLEEVATSSAAPSAEALIKLIETKLSAGQEISFEQAQLAGSYAQENRGSVVGQELAKTYLVALSASGAFEQAYEEFGRLSADLNKDQRHAVRSAMLDQLTKYSDDMTFLSYVFTDHLETAVILNANVANAAAERLLQIGFAKEARVFLAEDLTGEIGQERQLLRARVSLAEGRPRQAEVDLLRLSGTPADLLRAEARSLVGEHRAAAQLFASADQIKKSLNESWLAEDWENLSDIKDQAISDIAALALSDTKSENPQTNSQPERVLARNRDLVEQSASAREAIEAILQVKPMPEVSVE